MFYLADWKEDFFTLLYQHVAEVTEKNYHEAVLIFPTSRARHTCIEYFKKQAKQEDNSSNAHFLPEMLTVEEWLNLCQLFWQKETILAARQIDSLESIFILYEIVQEMAKSENKASDKVFYNAMLRMEEDKEEDKESFFYKPLHSFAYFYSYGEFLNKILQECFEENTLAFSLSNTEEHVEEFLAYLLQNITTITKAYIKILHKTGKTTKPYSKFALAKLIEKNNDELPLFHTDKKVFFCGLDRLTKTEEFFAKYFTQRREEFFVLNIQDFTNNSTLTANACTDTSSRLLHDSSTIAHSNSHTNFLFCSDPLLASEPESAHWSCAHYISWAKRWNQKFKLVSYKDEHSLHLSDFSDQKQIFSAFSCEEADKKTDKKSGENTEKKSEKKSVKKVKNIDAFYENSLLDFGEEKQKFYFYKAFDVHSQFQNLKIEKKQDEENIACILNTEDSLLPLLYTLYPYYPKDEELNITMGYALKHSIIVRFLNTLYELKKNKKDYLIENKLSSLFDSEKLLEFLSFPFFTSDAQEAKTKLIKAKKAFVDPFVFYKNEKNILKLFETLLQTFIEIDTLQKTVKFINSFIANIKPMLDENAFERLTLLRIENIAKTWEEKEYKSYEMTFELCYNLLIERIENEHLAFTHHSDKALQIMGLLETKLLSFDTVYIFDANEEFLPRKSADNPLLPERLRPYLGLLTSYEKELYYAHTWYRLIASAKNVNIFWQEASAKGLFETKKIASSYVEEIIWEVEQKNKALLNEESAEFAQALCPIELKEHSNYVLTSPSVKDAIKQILKEGISPSKIDTFISCPLRFFYENVCRFEEESLTKQGEDNAALGSFIHKFMQNFYSEGEEVKKEQLLEIFKNEIKNIDLLLEKFQMHDNFPPESLLLLRHTLNYRINKFIENQPEITFIEGIEKRLKAQVDKNINIVGVLDRIDKRKNELNVEESLVLDYKSFSVANKLVKESFWDEDVFFEELDECMKNFDNAKAKELVEFLYKNTQSIQLFAYIYLAHRNQYRVSNAAYVDLYESCEEKKIIFTNNDEKDVIEKKIPLILKFLTRYIQEIAVFEPNSHSKCDWCSFKKYCI